MGTDVSHGCAEQRPLPLDYNTTLLEPGDIHNPARTLPTGEVLAHGLLVGVQEVADLVVLLG